MQQLKDLSTMSLVGRGLSERRLLPLCSPLIASESAKRLLGCYRKGDAEDPDIYVGAIAVVLGDYPESVALRVSDPRTGIAGKSVFLPTVAEVRQACEAEMAPLRAEEVRAARRAESEKVMKGLDEAREKRATYDELREKYPDIIGHSQFTSRKPKLCAAEIAEEEARLDARRAALRKPCQLSSAALKIMQRDQ